MNILTLVLSIEDKASNIDVYSLSSKFDLTSSKLLNDNLSSLFYILPNNTSSFELLQNCKNSNDKMIKIIKHLVYIEYIFLI